MQDEIIAVRLMTIASSGLLIFFIGLGLYLFREPVTENIRFFLPIPPIGVAAYIFVFSTFTYYDGRLIENLRDIALEMVLGAIVAGGTFFILALGNLIVSFVLRRII
jgi:hypothetical protein